MHPSPWRDDDRRGMRWAPRGRVTRILFFCICGLVGLFVLAQAIPYGRGHSNPPVTKEPAWDSPQTRALAKRACFDCHSNLTTWPWYSNVAPMSWMLASHVTSGRDDFNYSEWKSYDEDDQDKLLGAMCNLTRRGRMPLPSYLVLHRDAKLSPAEVNAICNWSDKMRDTLQ
jgi:heme-binding protein